MQYIDCPHCGSRHVSTKNVEICRQIWSSRAHLQAWASHKQTSTIFYDKKAYLMWDEVVLGVHEHANHTCEQCGAIKVQFEVHHITPKIMGGNNALENLKLLCKPCHNLAHSGRWKTALTQEQHKLTDTLEE